MFVDSSAWFALLDADDQAHQLARRRFRRTTELRRLMITTNYVIAETYTLVRRRPDNRVALTFLQHVRNDALVHRVFVSELWEQDAERLLEQYDDQPPFSYVDATSFVAMRRLRIQEALAFDHDFVVAGFTLLGDD